MLKANRAPFGNRSGGVIDGTSAHDESLCSSRDILEQTYQRVVGPHDPGENRIEFWILRAPAFQDDEAKRPIREPGNAQGLIRHHAR